MNDANDMAAKLRTLDFDVILRTNASRREMSRAVSDFGKKLKPGSIGLFYFAGHGMQVRGKNFLIPVDAEIDNEASVRGESVDVDEVLDQIGPTQTSIVILDACRNNPFEQRFRRVGGGLAQIDAPAGTLLAYATAPGKVAADGDGANGIYTEALLRSLDTPGLSVEDVFKQVRNDVIRKSGDLQIPWESSSLTGKFYFRPDEKAVGADRQLREAEQARLALQKEMEQLKTELRRLKGGPAQPAGVETTAAVLAAAPATAPAATVTEKPASPREWAERLALLENLDGQLTLSKAVAILLDISSESELSVLLNEEKEFRSMRYASAYALGTDANGYLIWGGTYGWVRPFLATEAAREYCVKNPGDRCNVMLVNGDFDQRGFMEIARQLGRVSVSAARQAFRQHLLQKPAAFVASHNGGGGMAGGYAASFGFTSPRQP